MSQEICNFAHSKIDLQRPRSESFGMKLESAIEKHPRAIDPEKGREIAELVPGVGPGVKALLQGTAGSSPYLAGLIAKEAHWLTTAVDDVEAALRSEVADTRAGSGDDLSDQLRRAKRRAWRRMPPAPWGSNCWPPRRASIFTHR